MRETPPRAALEAGERPGGAPEESPKGCPGPGAVAGRRATAAGASGSLRS